ncbi:MULTISPECIES: Tim44 domain-containing protein [Ramlibacter]|uniref:Tim44 domain-containing protein n=1 Tax=Ramlibacter pinisoli TaxID=2682844 RepID=A0A6N8IRY5_9BURK|nr:MULTISPECIES: Tim44-like domain-containing protein [Ramlibacter]MBA2964633.1 Tim44 domain-containing protein [Ramlibacter sp. CGMCC 1.13660]MVQ29598.1 Tim44 domain-containing protein [Ramlibacter pinisoli]
MKLWTAVFASALALGAMDADAARRLGGGRSIGKQSGNVTQREAAPAAPAAPGAAPAQQSAAAQQARPAQPAPAAPAAAPRKPWGAMLGGLAAGLGLAWLANALGFGPALANALLIALFAFAALAIVGYILRGRRPAMAGAPGAWGPAPADTAQPPRQYSPDKVGNDASARPWERSSMAFDAGKYNGSGVQIGSGLTGPQGWGIPQGFDVPGFVDAAKRNFMTLQEAWDCSDIATLRSMMTDEMLAEIRSQLAEREKHLDGQPNKTEVVMLEAQLLGIEDLGGDYMASVEYSGMIREQPSAGPSPFREVWNMTKPKSGASGWLVAGVQALA